MNTIYRTCIVSLLFIFCISWQGIAQNENLRFEHIGIEEGLSNENVTAILQDSKGYMWFGTDGGGLNKYDGYSFTKYQFDPFDSNSLSQNVVYTIWEDKYGSIWVGTTDGLCRFDKSTEKFMRYKPDPKGKFSDPNIHALNEDNDGMMWVASISSGLCRFDRQREMFLSERFDLNGVNCVYKDLGGVLWVGNSTGLHRINLTAKKAGKLAEVSFVNYENEATNPNSLSSNNVRCIFEDHEGIMWLATDNGLNSFDKKTGLFKRYQHDPKNIHSISTNNLANWVGNLIHEDQRGNLWIATDKGLNKLNPDRTSFTSYFHNPYDAHSLSINNVIALHIDKGGVLYAACVGGKLNKVNLNSNPFGLKRRDPGDVNSISSNAVTSIVEDSAGIIWIGTYGGGLNRWDRKTDQFTHSRHDPANNKTLKSDTIQAVFEDRHGHLWVCNEDILSRLNKQTGEFTHYHTNVKNYKDPHQRFIFSVTEDHEGFIWLGTGNGIKRFNEKKGEFEHYYYNPADTNSLSDYTAITIFADSRDDIWVGYGSRGTDKFNKRTGRFIHFKHSPGDSASISSNVVKSIFEDSKGILWLGTLSGGLCYFDYQTEKFRTFTDKHGLPDNTVYSILTDNENHLWLGTDKGLSRFDPLTKIFTNYDYKDGLQSNKFSAGGQGDLDRGACFKARDGTLYFGGPNGLNFFDPLRLKADNHIAPIVITQFKLFDKPVQGASELKEIVFDYNQNYFSFEFSALSFYNPAKNQYAYKLEGVDKDWIYSGTRRYVSYTNIDPGTYTFRVKGTNNDGVWNERGTFISITINPPWWRTWWAYTFFVLFLAALVYAIFRYRLNKIRLQHEIELQQHKAAELEIESRQALLYERLRISRELHDDIGSTLSSISIYSEVAKKRTEKNENTDEVLLKIGVVSRDLIDKMSDIVWSLNPENESFDQLKVRIISFATMMLTPRNIRYNLNADERLKELHFTGEQRKNIFLIFKEALHNIVKYAACKMVNVTFCVKNDHLAMTITDDGKGFDAAKAIANNGSSNASPPGSMGGAGIKNMTARANAMNAKLSVHSKINEGTIVQLTFKHINLFSR